MKVFLKTFGCRVNQVESQSILEELKHRSYTITADYKEAALCILNTCTVTRNADKDVEKEAARIIKNNPSAKLILTGCYAAAHGDTIKQKFPTAQIIFKLDIGKELFDKDINWTVEEHEGHSRAFVKIQDGCDCFCSYCIVPYARPDKVSKPVQVILAEVQKLISNGYQEIVLTGINIGNYHCSQTGADLASLMPLIFALEGDFRIRFSSIEPYTITDKLLDAAQNPKFCNYLHIPLQSGCDKTLKDMKRRYNTAQYMKKVLAVRSRFKNIGIFCDIIAGYPTETEEDFAATLAFIKEVNFAGMHIFSYSQRPGTPAAALPQHSAEVIKQRAQKLREIDDAFRSNFALAQKGTVQQMLAEDCSSAGLNGVLGNFQRVLIPGAPKQKGLISVKIEEAEKSLCIGSLNLV